MKKRYYIITAIVSYLFFTLSSVPAAKVISLVSDNSNMPVKLYGVYGSLWDGGANTVMIQGQPASIDDLQWSINPASLLLASISADIEASVKEQNVVGNINISAMGDISASDVRAQIDASVMQKLVNMPLGELGGVFNINVEDFEMSDEGFPVVSANIKWNNAKLTLLETVDLGHINLDITPEEDNRLSAKITNNKGELSLDGTATIDPSKNYNLDLRITPEDSAKPNIRQSLGMFAKKQTDGSYLVKRKGNLRDLGL
ncbi:hypothetical protein MNBD_GAMMA09-1360 [hydrothermal vent metagenome]|uniref:General secretion pathway protein N n=1 Tax=hydrothermal vent metagenome TaxID=652676 RepID=A0A3B0X7H0_9ZZZZ